jgi:hypothetical protein
VTAALTAALRACAAGFYPSEAGTGLLISHGGFLGRPDFGAFIHTGISITDGITEMAEISWRDMITALHEGDLPVSHRNLKLIITAIQHAAGHRPPHP